MLQHRVARFPLGQGHFSAYTSAIRTKDDWIEHARRPFVVATYLGPRTMPPLEKPHALTYDAIASTVAILVNGSWVFNPTSYSCQRRRLSGEVTELSVGLSNRR